MSPDKTDHIQAYRENCASTRDVIVQIDPEFEWNPVVFYLSWQLVHFIYRKKTCLDI
jgi:hypothetical protein